MEQYITTMGPGLVSSLISLAVVVVLMVVGKKIDDLRTSFDDDDLVCNRNNLAIGFRRAGLYLGIAIAMSGTLYGVGPDKVSEHLLEVGGNGLAILALLFLAREVNDRFILRQTKSDEEIEKNNVAIGIAELGSYVATGLILNGSFSGEGGGVGVAAVFFILGQILLIALTALYGRLKSSDGKHVSLQALAQQGNASAAIVLAGVMIALGCIMRVSSSGNFMSWRLDLISFGITAALGVLLLVGLRLILGRLFAPNLPTARAVENNNVSAVLIIEGVVVSIAIILMTVL